MDDLVNPSILQRLAALVGKNGTISKPAANQPQLGLINLTMAKFYRVNGSSTQHKGVVPDINFPSLYPLDKIGEDTEKSALPWDTIDKSNYVPVADLSATRTELIKLHNQRMANSLDYKTLLQDLADLKKREGENSVSLNEVKLKKERDSLEAKALTKTNMLRAARGLPPVKKGDKITKEESFDFVQDESLKVMADLLQFKKTT
jgi:carboxyl-terminal processing protease